MEVTPFNYTQQTFTYCPVTAVRAQFASNMNPALLHGFKTYCATHDIYQNHAFDQAIGMWLQHVQMPAPAPVDPRIEALKPIDAPSFWDAVDSLRRVYESGARTQCGGRPMRSAAL